MQVNLEVSNTGRSIRIYNESGSLRAVLIIHGFLDRALLSQGNYVFYGEMYQLAGYERIDVENEVIYEQKG